MSKVAGHHRANGNAAAGKQPLDLRAAVRLGLERGKLHDLVVAKRVAHLVSSFREAVEAGLGG